MNPKIVATIDNSNIAMYVLTILSLREKIGPAVRRGEGGLLVYISKDVPYIRRHDIEQSEIESIWLEINYPNRKSILINFVYRPPNSKQNWIDTYEKQIDLSDLLNYETYILGDLNIDYNPTKSIDKYSNKKWQQLIEYFGLVQIIKFPTRVTRSSSSIIDHVYTSTTNFVKDELVSSLSISDHYPVSFTRILSKSKSIADKGHKHEYIQYRSFKNFDEIKFRNTLASVKFSIIESMHNPNDQIGHFYNILNGILSKQAPIKIKRVKQYTQPGWFNDEIKEAIFERNKLHKEKIIYKI